MESIRGEWRAVQKWISGSAQVLALAALCAISAELLAAYSDSTGDIGAILFNLIFFMALYGAPALFIRELARRLGWGWPSLLLLCAALGILQACIIDQSMFADQYGGYAGWEESRSATFIPPVGISAYNAYNFIIGHIIFSFAGPIAIAEAWWPKRAQVSWLGPFGMIIAAVFYIGSAALIMADEGSQNATQGQLVTSWVLVGMCGIGAALVGRRIESKPLPSVRELNPLVLLLVTFIVAVASMFAGEGWLGVAVGLGSTVLILAMIFWTRARFAWTPAHYAAVALGILLSRGALAFTYFPLLGEVEPLPKYLHNVAMLAIVLAAGALALKLGRSAEKASMVGARRQ